MLKKIIFVLFWSILLQSKLIAQSIPDGIIFQAMAKDNNGNAANNRTIYAIVSILTSNTIDTKIYTEKFILTSNADGIFTLVIGKGNRLSGLASFNSIVWDKAYFVNVKIAIAPTIINTFWQEDKEYVDLGISQFWTVPYAFYSTNAAYTEVAKTISTILPSNKGGTGVDNKGKTLELRNNFSILGAGDLVINTTRNSNITLPYTGTLSTLSGPEVLENKIIVSPILMGNPSAPTASLSSHDSSIATTLFVSSLVAQEIGKNSAKLSDNLINSINLIDSALSTKFKISDTSLLLTNYLDALNNLRSTKVNYTDTASMLTNYLVALNNLRSTKLNSIDTANLSAWKLNKVDTILLSNRINRKLDTDDFSVMIAPYLTKMNGVSYADTVAMLTNYLAALNNLRSSKLNAIDTAYLSTWKLNKADTANMLANYKSSVIDLKDAKLNKSDTANMLANYKAGLIALNADTLSLATRFSDVVNLANTKLKITDTANLSTWKLNKADTANMLANYKSSVIDLKDAKLNKSDTANMLANYKAGLIALNADTLSLATRFSDVVNLANTKLKITDTANLSAWKLNSVDTIALLQKQDTAAMLAYYAKRFTKDVTLHLATGKSLGKYLNNATIPATGKTLDEFLYDISTESIHPTYLQPVVSLTTSPAGATVEMGYNPGLITLSNIFTQNNGGAVTATTYYKNDVSLGVGITSNSPGTITSNITYKVIVNYAQGPILNDNLGIPDATGRISAGTATSAYITFTPQSKKYWGASNSQTISNASIISNGEYYSSPSKAVFGITISGTQFVYYAYPAIGADLTSILVGGFESINSFTKSIQSVTNASGYTQNYKVYISNNNFSASLNSIVIQ